MIPEVWAEEAVGQRDILSAYAGIRPQDIRGLRAPYLAVIIFPENFRFF